MLKLDKIAIRKTVNGLTYGFDEKSLMTCFVRRMEKPSPSEEIVIEKRNFTLYSNAEMRERPGEKYEVMMVSSKFSPDFKEALFSLIAFNTSPMRETVEAMENFFRARGEVTLEEVRGAFAEITILSRFQEMRPLHSGAIFDHEMNGVNIEVKSVAKGSRGIWLSTQQLENDLDADIYVVEVYEGDGLTLKELYNTTSSSHGERYDWIRESESPLVNKVSFHAAKYGKLHSKAFGYRAIHPETENIGVEFSGGRLHYKILPSITSTELPNN